MLLSIQSFNCRLKTYHYKKELGISWLNNLSQPDAKTTSKYSSILHHSGPCTREQSRTTAVHLWTWFERFLAVPSPLAKWYFIWWFRGRQITAHLTAKRSLFIALFPNHVTQQVIHSYMCRSKICPSALITVLDYYNIHRNKIMEILLYNSANYLNQV